MAVAASPELLGCGRAARTANTGQAKIQPTTTRYSAIGYRSNPRHAAERNELSHCFCPSSLSSFTELLLTGRRWREPHARCLVEFTGPRKRTPSNCVGCSFALSCGFCFVIATALIDLHNYARWYAVATTQHQCLPSRMVISTTRLQLMSLNDAVLLRPRDDTNQDTSPFIQLQYIASGRVIWASSECSVS